MPRIAVLTACAALLLGCGRESSAPPAPPGPPGAGTSVSAPPVLSSTRPEPEPTWHVLGSYETKYAHGGKDAPRAANVELAAGKLDGASAGPGAELSFNKIVGVRSLEAGFVEAPVIFMGELRQGVGGGVCQVSSTLHAAALAAGMEVVERLRHSRPSNYIMVGLDATVAYPPECADPDAGAGCYSSDLVLRNPNPRPVRVEARAEDGRLSVAVLGQEPPEGKVEFSSTFSWTEPFEKRLRPLPWKRSPDYRRKVQAGVRGRRAVLRVRTTAKDGGVREDRYVTNYPPVDEVWEVGKDWDEEGPDPWSPPDAGAGISGPGDAGAERP